MSATLEAAWIGHSPEQLEQMHDHLDSLKQRGI